MAIFSIRFLSKFWRRASLSLPQKWAEFFLMLYHMDVVAGLAGFPSFLSTSISEISKDDLAPIWPLFSPKNERFKKPGVFSIKNFEIIFFNNYN